MARNKHIDRKNKEMVVVYQYMRTERSMTAERAKELISHNYFVSPRTLEDAMQNTDTSDFDETEASGVYWLLKSANSVQEVKHNAQMLLYVVGMFDKVASHQPSQPSQGSPANQ